MKQSDRKQNGMRGNPLEEDLVFKLEQYVYSSAIDYAGEKGLLDITLIEKLLFKQRTDEYPRRRVI